MFILEKFRIKFLEAVNGKKAVKLVETQDKRNMPIKLIIMDISMPVMDGWEATKRIKQLYDEGKLLSMPAIVGHTAYTSDKDVIMCYTSGMVSYITKPATTDVIHKKIV